MTKSKKDSFIFYRSFFDAIKYLKSDDKCIIFDAICELALNQNETKIEPKQNQIAFSIFALIKPQIEANNKRFNNGIRGGRPINKKPKHNQTITKTKPNVNVNVNEECKMLNENGNGNGNINSYELIVKIWNDFAEKNSLQKIIKLSQRRKQAINARSKDKDFDLQTILNSVEKSNFLLGDNKEGWRVDFDFIFCSANNYLKILEGKYIKKQKKGTTLQDDYERFSRAIEERDNNIF